MLKNILSEHAEEAAFLWSYREQGVRSPLYTLSDIVELDNRLNAHLDGLRLAGHTATDICQNEFNWEEPGEIFVGAIIAFEHNDAKQIEMLINIAVDSDTLMQGLISALGWLPWNDISHHIQSLISSGGAEQRFIAISAMAVQGIDLGRYHEGLLNDETPLVRARALRSAGEMGRVDLLNQCRSSLSHKDESCRFCAARSMLLLGDRSSLGELKVIAESESPFAKQAADLIIRSIPIEAAKKWLKQLLENENHQHRVIELVGVIGDPSFIPWLIEQMKTPELARISGGACSMMMSVDIALEKLDCEPPSDFESGPNDDPEDESVEIDPDDDLPWPDYKKFTQWWAKEQAGYTQEVRYLMGQPVSGEQLTEVLKKGNQLQRASAALELALEKPEGVFFNIGESIDRGLVVLY